MLKSLSESRLAHFLLVDDNEDDVFLTREAFDSSNLKVHLHHVDNGEKCLQFLRKQGPYADVPMPDLILLDMNMPVMDGHQVLTEIVSDATLCHLPVVVLTTSYEAADIRKMYNLRCSSYITKPLDFDNFVKAIQQMTGYWLTVVVLPDK
ncbi:MAG: response regulator [Pseudomonadota bacterium]